MDHLRIDVRGAPVGGFTLVGAFVDVFTPLLFAALGATLISVFLMISERVEYAPWTYGLGFAVWFWWVFVRPRRAQARVRAYDRSLGEMRTSLRRLRGGGHRSRYAWLALNLAGAAAAALAANLTDAAYVDPLGVLAVAFLMNGMRLWSDKSGALKTLFAWALIAAVWLLALGLWGSLFADGPQEPGWQGALGFVFMILIIGVGVYITRRIAPWSQASMEEMRARDRRPPILFLRSFDDEAQPILGDRGPKLEHVVKESVRPYGPFIGIGRPGELTPAGAARKYFADDAWQPAVLKLMDEAALIVVLPGLTKGLDWEMHRLGENGRLRKTLLVVAPTRGAERFARLRAVLAETPEGARLQQVDLSQAMSLHLTRDWRWAVAHSSTVSFAEYQAAIDVGVYGLLCAGR